MSTVGRERAVLRHPRLASLATAEWPAWLWSADGTRILWANAVGAAIFGTANSTACTARHFTVTALPAAQVLRLAATLPSGGQERLERLRGFGGNLGRALTCTCSRIIAGDGRGAVLIVAAEPAGPALTLAERARRLVGEDGDPAAVFMTDGRLIYANAKAAAWLNGADTLAGLGLDALAAPALQTGSAKAPATLSGHACEIVIARLGRGEATVLLLALPQPTAESGQTLGAAIEAEHRPAEPVPPANMPADARAGAKGRTEIGALPQRRHPLRFVWNMDAEGRFNIASEEFLQLIGWRAASLGQPWRALADELALDPDGRVAKAVASRETWSGIAISWPIAPSGSDRHTERRLQIELSGLPIFDRDRNFGGYRGFGVCRDMTQINGLARPAQTEAATPATPAPAVPPAAPATAEQTTGSDGEVAPANVVPFRPVAAPEPKPVPSLTPIERHAFRELAQELTSRLRGTQVAVTAEALAQELSTTGRNQALSQDELRDVLTQALIQENGQGFDEEKSQTAAQEFGQKIGQELSQHLSQERQQLGQELRAQPGESDTRADERSERAENQEPDTEPLEAETQQPGDMARARLGANGTDQADPLPASSRQVIEPALLDRIPLGIVIYRHDGLLYANRQFLELSGYDDMAAIEADGGLNRLFAEPANAEFADSPGAQALAIVTRAGQRVSVEGRMVTVHWNTLPAMALFITKQYAGAVATGPAAQESQEQLKRASEGEAQTAAKAKAEFVARISHDIRNPLNAITGFAEAIMSERFGPIGNERYREYIKDLHAAAAHLSSMVDDLFDLSKLDSGRIALTFGSVNLNDLIQQCVGMMQPQANRARIIIRSALTSGLPLVKADERALRQIVLNLLSNSIKFTGPGGQIIVSTVFSDTREAILRVRDTGVGMSEKQMVAALAPSADINAWPSSGSGGTELGLPLTKALAEANHAQFRIKSAPEAGTLVEIAFAPTRTLAA